MTPEQKKRLFELFIGHAADELKPDEHVELQEKLRGDAEARRLWFVHQDVEMGMRLHLTDKQVVTEKNVRRSSAYPWRSLAACLAFLLGVAAFHQLFKSDAVVLQVVGAENARLAGRADILLVGANLPEPELVLESGFLRVRLGNGVLLDLNGPLAATFESGMRMRLRHGRMGVDVGNEGKGFTVVTDAGEVVDLGTRFGVESDAKGESRVAVFSGEVKVRTGGSGSEFTKIHEGEAARFTALAGLRRWTEVALAVDASGLERTPKEGVIASARDNLGNEELHPFYGIVHEGMRPGALAFTDKPNPRWAPMPGDTLPSWLQGADLVRTYHQFRQKRDYALTLNLREAADVSVLIDAHQEPPTWLKERFTDTGARVRVGPWMQKKSNSEGVEIGEDGQPYRSFAVWRATVAGGEVVLGPSHLEMGKNIISTLMYGVAVKALPPKSSPSN